MYNYGKMILYHTNDDNKCFLKKL
uniref:Uncharacterized protein n=1 Tax=Anguilla anguilla TaxID=7936 RepID=A0A0E9U054_ANGAN